MFFEARTHRYWQPRAVPRSLLERAWNMARLPPTSANCSPLRMALVESPAAKEKLKPALIESNVRQTLAAPVTAIFAWDNKFYDFLPRLYPPANARAWYAGAENEVSAQETAFRNSSLQAAYFMLSLRALGLDCGPMSGFDAGKINAAFFPEGRWQVNFICNIGYGDKTRPYSRSPRLNFDEISRSE